jgi:hypothetical protein
LQRAAGGGFSAPLQLGTALFDAPFGTPQAAFDGDGDAVVVWPEPEGAIFDTVVQVAFKPAGGSFGAPVRVSAPGSATLNPQVAMNAAGDTVVVWERVVNEAFAVQVQAAVRPAGGTFSESANVSAVGLSLAEPRVAIDAAGTATVVWTQMTPATATIQAATRPAGGQFSPAVDLASFESGGPFSRGGGAEVATNPAGETVAIWSRVDEADDAIVQAATRSAGGTFFAPVDLSAPGRSAGSPQVAIDAAGNAVAVWTRFDGSTGVVQVAQRAAGEAFSAPVDLSLVGGQAQAPQVVVNAAGDAVVAWQRSNGTNMIVQATVGRAGATFPAPIDLSLAGQDAAEPRVGIDADGDAIATWRRSNAIVQAAGYDGAGPQLRRLSIPAAVSAGTAATFSLSPLDVWSAVTSTQWSFDDGASATGASVSHAFSTIGEHTVTVTATDALGNATSASRTVTVAAPTPPPSAPAPTPPPPAPAPAPPAPSAPSNRFSVIAATAQAGGVIRLIVRASAVGTYRAVATTKRSKRAFKYGRGQTTVRRAGRVTLTIRPTLAAKRRLSARNARVAIAVTFKPTSGAARTKHLTVVVKATRRH